MLILKLISQVIFFVRIYFFQKTSNFLSVYQFLGHFEPHNLNSHRKTCNQTVLVKHLKCSANFKLVSICFQQIYIIFLQKNPIHLLCVQWKKKLAGNFWIKVEHLEKILGHTLYVTYITNLYSDSHHRFFSGFNTKMNEDT